MRFSEHINLYDKVESDYDELMRAMSDVYSRSTDYGDDGYLRSTDYGLRLYRL